MSILIELEPFGKPEAGLNRFATALREARARNIQTHSVFEWASNTAVHGPTLAFDLQVIRENMRWLATVAGAHMVTPLLAVKSCTQQPYLALAQEHLGGYDVSNLNEYRVLPEDLRGRLVSLTSPVLAGELEAFATRGNELLVTLDSPVQLEQYFARPRACPYLLRVRGPDLLRGVQPADPAFYPVTRFGFSTDEVRALLQDPRIRAEPPAGFHVHHGSEINQRSTFERMIAALAELAGALQAPLRCVNLGGGWHPLAQHEVEAALVEARRRFPEPCRVLLEPGRWYAASAGYAIGRVANQSREGNILRCTLDLSARCHLHWSQPRLLHFAEPGHDQGCIVQFYGASCYESDLVGKYYLPCSGGTPSAQALAPGAQVLFGNISTYSAEWNTSFNGIPAADIVWIDLPALPGQV
jgi:diaminopimelate decarboxylase